MAEQVAILFGGQSQGNKVSEITKFEDQTPETSPRNANVFGRTPVLGRTFTQDLFTLPGVWPEKYKNLRLRGRATTAVMRLSLFNPASALYEMQDVSVSTLYGGLRSSAYPGYAAVSATQDSYDNASIALDCVFQADPAGLTVVRESTGTSHTIGSGWVNTAPGLISLVAASGADKLTGEVYKLPLQCRATGTTTVIPSNVRFGGYNDLGSLFEGAYFGGTTSTLDGHVVQPYPTEEDTVGTGAPLSFNSPTRHYRAGMRVRFETTGANTSVTVTTTDYWITRVDTNAPNDPKFYVSASLNGPEVVYSGTPGTGDLTVSILPQHFGTTMAGTRARFTSGLLAGQAFDLADNVLVSGSPTDDFSLVTLEIMPSVPQIGDTFEIEPQTINGEDVSWDEFGHFLPECTMAGQNYGQPTTVALTYNTVTPGTAVVFTGDAYEGMRLRIYDYFNVAAVTTTAAPTSGSFTGAGQVLYVRNYNYTTKTFNVSVGYTGVVISDATLTADACAVFVDEHPDRFNPLPPGWNYDNSAAWPGAYQPYFGAQPDLTASDPGATLTTATAMAMHEKLGRSIYVIHTNVGGSSVGRREAAPAGAGEGSAHGGFDSNVVLDWAPNGEVDNCYAFMVRKLVTAKRAAAAAGHTLKIAGVFFPQGESDITFEGMLERYPDNIRGLIKAVRAKIVELGMWDGDAASIPWWQPHVPITKGNDWGGDNYASNIAFNDILDALAIEDPYFVTRAIDDDVVIGYDSVHYSGDYQFTLGMHAFNDWETIAQDPDDRTRVDICNQALKNLGESRVIESLTEDTAAAKLCNRYYKVAERTLLEMFPWTFATTTVALIAATNPREDLDWQYAYALPVNFLGVVGVGPDSAGAYVADETEYTIEGSVLYCNLSVVTLRYTTIAPDPATYSQHYTNALSHQLSVEIAPALVQGDRGAALVQSQMQLAVYFVDQARAHAANRLRHAEPTDSNYAWD